MNPQGAVYGQRASAWVKARRLKEDEVLVLRAVTGQAVSARDESKGGRAWIISSKKISQQHEEWIRDENLDKYYSQFLLQNQLCSSGKKSPLWKLQGLNGLSWESACWEPGSALQLYELL